MTELDQLSHQLMIIIGIPMYILGLFGNVLNICVFTAWAFPRRTLSESHHQTRTGNSSLYLITTSVANLVLTMYPLLVRILVDGFQYKITESSGVLLCKFRYYVLQTSLVVSLICTCLATFDRYLLTSRQARLRQLTSTRKTTKKIICLVIVLAGLHSVPIAIYYDRSVVGDCIIHSLVYSTYYLYVVIVCLYGVFPIAFLIIFGRLTYQQIRVLQEQASRHGQMNMDKQISRMLLLKLIALVCSYIPYCVQNIYFSRLVIDRGDRLLTSLPLLLRIVTIILFYVNPVASFYIFFISTPNFRHQVKELLRCRRRYQFHEQNRVHIITLPPS